MKGKESRLGEASRRIKPLPEAFIPEGCLAADEPRSTGMEAVLAEHSNPKLPGPSRKGVPPGLRMDPLAAIHDPATPPLTIVFFGLGAVGSSMLICLSELADRDDVPLRFVVVVLNDELARDALFHAERLFERIDFIALPDFAPLFDGSAPELQQLAGAQVLVNAAQPGFNTPLL